MKKIKAMIYSIILILKYIIIYNFKNITLRRYILHQMNHTLMKYVCYGVNLTRLMIAASLCLVHSQNQCPLIFTLPNIKNC